VSPATGGRFVRVTTSSSIALAAALALAACSGDDGTADPIDLGADDGIVHERGGDTDDQAE
jgi:hypothetical protein